MLENYVKDKLLIVGFSSYTKHTNRFTYVQGPNFCRMNQRGIADISVKLLAVSPFQLDHSENIQH